MVECRAEGGKVGKVGGGWRCTGAWGVVVVWAVGVGGGGGGRPPQIGSCR